MSLFNKNKNIGFTLIELTTVVAIIGILAAVAVPQYNRFQALSRTSEARIGLSGIYTVELAFRGDSNSFGTCLGDMGYDPGLKAGRFYTMGFATKDGLTRDTGTGLLGGVVCNAGVGEKVSYWEAGKGDGGVLSTEAHLPDSGGASVVSGVAFKAGAVANLLGGITASQTATDADRWTINQAKTIINTTPEQ